MKTKLLLLTLFVVLSTRFSFSQEVSYQLSSHILDINSGYPASDVKISLYKLSSDNEWLLLDEKFTDL